MLRKFLKIRYFTGMRGICLLVLLLGLKWLIANKLTITADLARTLNLSITVACLALIVILIFESCKDFFLVFKRVSAGVRYLIKSFIGIKSRKAPEVYVRDLFDDYAEDFDDHLVSTLEYKVPETIYSILKTNIDTDSSYKILDLGCGTGLCAEKLKPLSERLVGLDLSENMIKQAKQKGLYDELICDTLTKANQYFYCYFDLVVSADVLIYFGQLDEAFESIYQTLKPNGFFIFSLEDCKEGSWTVKKSGRYAHSRAYVFDCAQKFNFEVLSVENHIQRQENYKPVTGDIYLLQRL